jgi:hypothetical protein
MSHLTTNEVFQIVDETLANGVRTKIVAHLEICARCRQEVEFQRRVLRVAKGAPLVRPSADFRERVLKSVTPQSQSGWLSKIVNNLGSILAMGIVLTIVWFAGSNTSPGSGSTQPSIFSGAVKTYIDYYARARDFVATKQAQLLGEPAKNPTPRNDNVIYLTIVSILILVAADRFVVRRLLKIRV